MALVKRKRKNGSVAWGVLVYSPSQGRMVWAGTRDTKTEAKLLEATYEVAAENIQPFSKFAASWLSTRAHVRPSTMKQYKHGIAVATAYFGDTDIASIDTESVERFVAELTERYAPYTVNVMYTVFRMAMKTAWRYGRIERDPCVMVNNLPRRKGVREIHPLTRDQHAALVQAMHPHYRDMTELWPYVMLRPGEMFGLTESCVERTRILIRRQLQRGLLVDVKRPASKRDIPLPDKAAAILDHYESTPNQLGVVFTTTLGNPIAAFSYAAALTAAGEAIGVPDIRPYDLRHTGATWHLYAGTPIKTLSHLLGHESTSLTLDTYTHFMPSEDDTVLAAFNRWAT